MNQKEIPSAGTDFHIQRGIPKVSHKVFKAFRKIFFQRPEGKNGRICSVAKPEEQALHLFETEVPDVVLPDFIYPWSTLQKHILMVPENKTDIRAAHHPPEHGNAAVTVPVDNVAQHIQAVGIREAGCFQETKKSVQRVPVKIGRCVNHNLLHQCCVHRRSRSGTGPERIPQFQ